jgi:hypothetical protein
MAGLFPTFPAPPAVTSTSGTASVKYGSSWEFDFATGDFKIDGTGRVREVDGHSAWVQWCLKAVLTQRQACLAYTHGFGCEVQPAMRRAASRKEAESEITRTITEALLADPRTRTVRDFSFIWEGDAVQVAFTIEPTVGTAERLEVSLSG